MAVKQNRNIKHMLCLCQDILLREIKVIGTRFRITNK